MTVVCLNSKYNQTFLVLLLFPKKRLACNTRALFIKVLLSSLGISGTLLALEQKRWKKRGFQISEFELKYGMPYLISLERFSTR